MKWIRESKRCQMKIMRSLAVVDACRRLRDATYAVMRRERAARREKMVVWSMNIVDAWSCVVILAAVSGNRCSIL